MIYSELTGKQLAQKKEMAMKEQWKVGDLAKLTGLTVRTLRYYDQIGLFSPSEYSESGHRLYNKADLARLQQIQSLKQMGLSLEEVQLVLTGSNSISASELIFTQMARLKEDIGIQQTLLNELEHVSVLIHNKQPLQSKDLIKLLGAMKMNQEKYFTKEQLDNMKGQYKSMDAETMKKAEQEFTTVLNEIRNHMQQGSPATDLNVQRLAKQWQELVDMFTPKNDPEFIKAAEKFHAENPGNDLQFGVDAEVYQYIGEALRGN
ncbi:MerR family transcriptional regulator [Sporosarcina sp. FSL K6-1508]|uniref:MerR family transcriptional regulator n=1 Tax=Sporosarcina sp. FSL K6-1508 TaxID=2921553 RepID=UPI0030FC1848